MCHVTSALRIGEQSESRTVKRRKAGRSLGTRLFFEMDVSEVCGFEDGRRAFNTATSTTANSGFGLYGKQDSDRRFD